MPSNSQLVSYVDSSSPNYNQRTGPISKITIHHAAGKLTLQQFSSILQDPSREVSWNYAISYDGKIGLYIPEKYRAWTSSNRDNDMIAVTIEVSNSANDDPWPISNEAYTALLNLCEDICRRNNIESIHFTGNKSGNLTMHKWFSSTGCPGPTLEPRFIDIAKKVNVKLGKPCTLEYVTNPTTGDVTAAGFGPAVSIIPVESLVDYSAFTPYVATIDRNVSKVDFDELKEASVSVVMIEAGYLYDDNHKVVDNYANPQLDKHVVSAGKANLNYGLVATVRATSLSEANSELKELTRIVQKYLPPYGIWLQLNLSASKSTNNSIIDRYAYVLKALGLTDKIGLYANRTQMKKIDWNEKRQNTWYLWLIDHVEDKEHLSQLLSPEFFMFDESKASDVPVINTTIYGEYSTPSYVSGAYSDWLFVGDSRTVGMEAAVGSIKTIAKVGAGYSFLHPKVSHLKNNYHNTNIVLWFGVNDLYNVDKYIEAYNELADSMTDCKIIVVNVGPARGDYADLMPDIQDFNAMLETKLNSNVSLVDVFTQMQSATYTTTDGLHYKAPTYRNIYKLITEGTYGNE